MALTATSRSRAANVSALIRKSGLTPKPSGSGMNVDTGTVVRAGGDWPTVSIHDPYDRPSDNRFGEREVKDRTEHVVKVLTEAGYLFDWTVRDLGGVHGWFGHITITGRRPKMTKTAQAALIARQAAEICRGARKAGYSNAIGERELAETAQALMIDADSWTIRKAAHFVREECTARGEREMLADEIYSLTAHK